MKTLVGVKKISLYMSDNLSAGSKKKIINKIKDHLKKKFNVSFAEIDAQKHYQRTVMALAMVSNSEDFIRKSFQAISGLIEEISQTRIISDTDDIFYYEDELEEYELFDW